MGVDKRDYMRAPRGPGLAGHWAVLGTGDKIIAWNVLVFVLWQIPALHGFMSDEFLVSWRGIFEHGRVWTVVTAAFSHEGFWHLGWNMLYLHWFALELEQIYGKRNFLLLYLQAAVVSSLAHVFWAHWSGWDGPALGASGAVMAVVVVAALFFPQRLVSIWFFPLPLWLLAAVKLVGDLTGMVGAADGIGHAAHLGGAVAGALFWWLDLRLFASPGNDEPAEHAWGAGAWLRKLVARRAPPPRPAPAARVEVVGRVDVDALVVNLRVDELLRKISSLGMSSLTPEELDFLKAASQRPQAGP